MATIRSLYGNEETEMNLMDEEEINDPDIEARLYAEIYYSNDTYPDHNVNQEYQSYSQTPDPKTPDNSLWCVDPQPGRSDNQYRHDKTPQPAQYIKKTGFFPKRYRALLDGPIDNVINQRNNRSRNDDWSLQNNFQRIEKSESRNQRRRTNCRYSLRPMKPPERPRRATKTRLIIEEDDEPDRTSLTALDETLTSPAVQTASRPPETSENPPQTADQLPRTMGSSLPLSAAFPSSVGPDKNRESSRESEEIDDNSKYEVEAKKVRENESGRVDADESDSDASIFEVPVPPKPAPPLISLKDSDEESSSSDEESPVVMDNKSSEQLNTSRESPSLSSSSPIILDDSDESSDNGDDVNTDNIIINCTDIQKGASSIDEIKRIRDNAAKNTIVGQSDEESMTESEAMNWKSLEGEITREKRMGDPNEGQNEFWNEFSDDSGTRKNLLEDASLRNCDNSISITSEESAVDEELSKDDEVIDKGNDEMSRNKRVHGEGGDKVVEVNEPARKKKKQKENSREMSFQEYMFQPMPKQMVAFYNNPRGGEMMKDIKEIQNGMPKNPNRWAILDEDMHPSGRRTRIVCAICQREGHVRSKCPNRSKPPTCHICGFIGHMEPRCPYNKQCINCGNKYGTCRKTCELCNTLRCSQCSGKGHTMASCPDNWRKYHQTTSGTEPNIPKNTETILKPSNQLSCCNCTKRGHDAAFCINYRWSAHFIQKCHIKDYSQGPSYRTPLTLKDRERIVNDARQKIDAKRLGIDVNGPSSYLFHFVNCKPQNTREWKEHSMVPNKLNGIDYPLPGATPIYPKFLKVQFNNRKCCPMEVIVRRSFDHNGLPEIILKTPDSDSLERLKIIILQWLIRCRADKDGLTRAEALPQHSEQLFRYFSGKRDTFMKKKIMKIGPDELNSCKSMEKSLLSKNILNKSGAELNEEDKKRMRILKKLKTKFVVATYKYILIDTIMDTFSCFMDFMKELEQLDCTDVPGVLYMTAVWYNFELFVPHLSPAVVDAVKRWVEAPILGKKGIELFQNKYGTKESVRSPIVTDVDTSTIPSLLSLDWTNVPASTVVHDPPAIPSMLSDGWNNVSAPTAPQGSTAIPSLLSVDSNNVEAPIAQTTRVLKIGRLCGDYNREIVHENDQTVELAEIVETNDCGESSTVPELCIKRNKSKEASFEENHGKEVEIEEIDLVDDGARVVEITDNNCAVIDDKIKIIESSKVDNRTVHTPNSSEVQTSSSRKKKKRKNLTLSEISMQELERKGRKQSQQNELVNRNEQTLRIMGMANLSPKLSRRLKNIIKNDAELSIPAGMPVPKDPRKYDTAMLKNRMDETMKFIKRQKLDKARRKMKEYMSQSKNGSITKQQLIDVWTMIRAAMKRKKKIEKFLREGRNI